VADWQDLRALVEGLCSPSERAQLRPAMYEVRTPDLGATGGISTGRTKLPKGQPFIVTGLVWSSSTAFVGAQPTIKLRWEKKAGDEERGIAPVVEELSVGDVALVMLLSQQVAFGMRGSGLPAPIYIDAAGGITLDLLFTGAVADMVVGLTGFHAPRSIVERCRRELGSAFIVRVSHAANQTGEAATRVWEVPSRMLCQTWRQQDAAAGVTLTLLQVDIGRFTFFPVGITTSAIETRIPRFPGQCAPQPGCFLRAGDELKTQWVANGAESFFFFFSRFDDDGLLPANS
jgi:hypothetical protein